MTTNTTAQKTERTPTAVRPKRRAIRVAAIPVGLAVVATMAIMGHDASAGSVPATHPAVVEIPMELRTSMELHGMSGLSPASAAPIDHVYTTQDLAGWAKQNNMTGLSAASLKSIDDSRD